jgi:hypothetical protein
MGRNVIIDNASAHSKKFGCVHERGRMLTRD